MKHLGFIPVRGGSKRLPRKNLMDLGGKSITHRAIDEALESGMFSDIVLSTDDDEIIQHCKKYEGQIIIDKRDPALAQDTSTVLQVALDYIDRDDKRFETIAVMLATCPFRKARHIREAYKLYGGDLDGILSVCEYDFPWEFSLDMQEDLVLKPSLSPSPLITKNTRSQDRKKVYHPNGALYICNKESLKKNRNFFMGKIKGYEMDKLHSQDIDEMNDMLIAKFLIEKGLV